MIQAIESQGGAGRRGAARWRRCLAHLFFTPLATRRAFPPATMRNIGAAIERAEAGHGGEIVFVVEGSPPWPSILRNEPVRRRAIALFAQLRVWDTEHNNGVLVYVGLADRTVEIVADRGLASRVEAEVWHTLCRELRDRLRLGQYEAGAVQAIAALGELQRRYFPLAPGQSRRNELPDRPLVL